MPVLQDRTQDAFAGIFGRRRGLHGRLDKWSDEEVIEAFWAGTPARSPGLTSEEVAPGIWALRTPSGLLACYRWVRVEALDRLRWRDGKKDALQAYATRAHGNERTWGLLMQGTSRRIVWFEDGIEGIIKPQKHFHSPRPVSRKDRRLGAVSVALRPLCWIFGHRTVGSLPSRFYARDRVGCLRCGRPDPYSTPFMGYVEGS